MDFKTWLTSLEEIKNLRNSRDFEISIASQCQSLADLPDFIGRFESLEQDFRFVCGQIGFEPSKLLNVNPTTVKDRHYSTYYNDETRELVAARYADDIERYGYNFSPAVSS